MAYQSKQFRARMLSLAAALAAASPVPALDACTGASAALAAHHCASLRDLFARAAIVNCSSDPCGCWCARDDDGSAVWRQADQLCSANLCAEPPQAVDARGEALRRLDGIVGFAVNPIDRSGHHGGHKKLWWEPDCAPSRLNMARWLPACLPAQRMTHRCPLYRCSLLDGPGHHRAVSDHAWSVRRVRIDNRPHCLQLTEGLADVSQLVRPAIKPHVRAPYAKRVFRGAGVRARYRSLLRGYLRLSQPAWWSSVYIQQTRCTNSERLSGADSARSADGSRARRRYLLRPSSRVTRLNSLEGFAKAVSLKITVYN